MSQPLYVFRSYFHTAIDDIVIQTEAGSRMLVDAFLLRVAAMSKDNGIMLIFPEYTVPMTRLHGPDDTLEVAGKLDYFLVLLSAELKDSVREYSEHHTRSHIYPLLPATILKNGGGNFDKSKNAKGFAIIEAKSHQHSSLGQAMPQAILQVAALAKQRK